MARGVSLHVGVNRVNVNAFSAQGLVGCENDAVRMSEVALQSGFTEVKLLLGPDATFDNVVAEIMRAATGPNKLVSGDIFLFTFAGHGSRIPDEEDLESLTNELDGHDEALVLFDRLLLDDYLRRLVWPEFEEGVRIVGVADSCHSATALFAATGLSVDITEHVLATTSDGSGVVAEVTSIHMVERVLRRPSLDQLPGVAGPVARNQPPGVPVVTTAAEEEVVEINLRERAITGNARRDHYEEFRPFYNSLEIPSLTSARRVRAGLLLMAACGDGGRTPDGFPNGAFTTALLGVWNNGAFSGSYDTFMERIIADRAAALPEEVPVLTTENLPTFSGQRPFSI